MKITSFLLLVFAMQVSAAGYGQGKLSLRYKNAEIAGILLNIEKQSQYRFLYNDQLPGIRKKVSIEVENADIYQALDNLFSQTVLTYRVMANNLIVINENARPAPDKKVTGRITDATGLPLSGVSVNIKGTSRGTVTDEKGQFTIMAEDADILVFSYVNYETQEVKVGNRTDISLSLASSASNLENIVVIGYGTVRKRDLTGAVVSLKGDEVKKVPAGNVMESVQGKVAGVDITRTTGGAGANVNITVRGNRSIMAQNTPLFIVDGIQYPTFQDINPNDIQSMEVLKDASSTAIYGSRGANGVIIITTKRGAAGKIRVAANAYYGVNDVAGYPKPMNAQQYADLRRQANRTAGLWNSTADDSKIFPAADLASVQNGVNTYWPGLILEKGSQQDYGVSVGAGSEKTKVFFSFDYFKEKGILANDFSGRYTLRLNIDQTIIGTFKVGLQSQLTYYDENRRNDNILTVANKVLPYFSAFNNDGTLIKFPGNANQPNPLLQGEPGAFINKVNTTRLLSSAYAEWKPTSSLTLRSNLGITTGSSRVGNFQGENTIQRALSSGSLAAITNATQLDLIWENIITWNKKFGEHNLDVTAVTSYLSNETDSSLAQGTGQLLPGQSFYALVNNPANIAINSNYVESKLLSGAFRLNYGFKGKYLLTLTGRADGASVLSKENRWAFFPAAAAAWRIIDEPFMANTSLLSDLKLRLSYGRAGNAAVRPYSTVSGLILIPWSWNEQTIQAYGFNPQTGNRNLQWELTGTANVGLDFSLLKNRISASVDYYDSKTSDLLLLAPLPGTSGFTRVLENVGRTRNNGFEVTLRTVNLQKNGFNWTSAITYTRNKERILELVGNQNDVAANLFIGKPVRSFYDYQKLGVWQTADTALARSFKYKAGDIRVSDVSGPKGVPDGVIDANYDRVVVGSAVPRYTLGFNNDFSFKNFDLNIYVFARIGQMFVSDYANKFEPNAIENGAVVNYWTPENPSNDYPRPNINTSRSALPFATTLGYKDGSFVKIRNITLGYTLPRKFTERFHIRGLRWYASAKNYFTFAKVDDYDPEGEGSFDRPLTKLIVTGINIDF